MFDRPVPETESAPVSTIYVGRQETGLTILIDICMAPASLLSEEDRKLRVDCFSNYRGTTHVPFAAIYSRDHEAVLREDGKPCPHDTGKPRNAPKHSQKLLRLVGAEFY